MSLKLNEYPSILKKMERHTIKCPNMDNCIQCVEINHIRILMDNYEDRY